VVAIDPVENLISAAEQAGSADYYRIAVATDLPFENCSFDLAVAYNVLMDVEDVPGALKEIRGFCVPREPLLFRLCTPSPIAGISLVRRPTLRSYFRNPISVGSASRVPRCVKG
jgi:ubiquinone/menaquinone biosynthesis C-methylase UbiE